MTPSRCLPVAFRTLGCKVNQAESERIAADLLGGECVQAEEADAAVFVINTCTVTSEADRKARKEVRRALALPQAPVVVVTGCLAALDADGMRALGERVVVEADKGRVAQRVSELLATAGVAATASPGPLPRRRSRAQVLVEDGCDAYCSYCIVPYARGVPRTAPLPEVVRRVGDLVRDGVAEVVLTGVNIGRYRDEAGADLADVIRAVAATGIRRVRLSSIEPMHLPGRLLEALAETPCACPHLHVPLQSGSDRVLRAMDRGYDTAGYAGILAEARAAIPRLAVSTDVIVGFPGETLSESMATQAFVEECRFMRLHVFRYSRREGTLAALMPRQVDPRDKQVRSERLRALGDRLAIGYARSRLGGTAEVLVERVSEGIAEGTSEDYLKVRAPAGDRRPGELTTVTLTGLGDGCVIGG